MANVTVILAKPKEARGPDADVKLRVCAYCRVSTDNEDQLSSYEGQIKHYTELIRCNFAWVNAGVFADEGVTGINTKKRVEFNRMIADLEVVGLSSIK